MPCDYVEGEYLEYSSSMPWKTLPFKDPRCERLPEKFGVTSIPRLMIFRPDGKYAVDNARGDVQTKGMPVFEEWLKSP